MGPESANMLDHVTLEASNSSNPELGWKTVTKGKRSKKPATRNFNEINKVGNRSPMKLNSSVTRKLVSNGADHIPPKKRRVLRTPSETQLLAKEDPVSPQPHTPSPHGDSKPQSKVFCKSSAINSAGVSEDLDQKLYNPDDFSGIALLAAAAGIDFLDVSSHLQVTEEYSISEKADMSASREPIKCSISIEPQSSPSDVVKESTDTTYSSLGNGDVIPRSMQVNENVSELEAPKGDRLHWDLNLEMDSWEQPSDIRDHNPEVEKLEGEGCKVSPKSDYSHIADNHNPLVQIEQVSLGPANVTDRASVGISAFDMGPTKSINDLAGKKPSSNLRSVVQSHQVLSVYVDEKPRTASENITIVRETEKVINQTTPFTDAEDSMQNIELAVLKSSQHDSNINSVVDVVAEETSYLPDNSGNNSPTKQAAHFSHTNKDFSTSGASTHSGFFNPEGQANSTFVPDTTVIEGAVLPFLSPKDDGSQSCDPTGSSAKVGSRLDDCRCSDVSQGDGSNTVGSNDMTGIQDGNDSPYEDGELRLSMPCPWVETELDYGYNECVDYESDGADYPGSEVVEAGSDGSLGVEKRSISDREASVPELNSSGSLKSYMNEDVELGGTMNKSKVEYYKCDNSLRRRHSFNHSGGIEPKGSHLEEMNSRTNRIKSHSHFQGSECLDVMEKINTGYLQQNNRSHAYSRPIRDVGPHTFMDRQRSHFHVRERNEEDDRWSGQWGSGSNISSGYRGPAGHSYNRPRNMAVESEKFSESNSQDHRQSMHYSSKAPFTVDNRRLSYEKDDFHCGRNRTTNNNRSVGNSGNYTQEVSRGNRNDSYDPSQENRILPSNRIPRYLPRPEPRYSPPARASHNLIPRRRFRSRSKSRSPCVDRRYTRSPDFRSPSSLPYALVLLLASVVWFVVYPAVQYFRDPKGLRRYHNMSLLSGVSAIPFMILAHGGFRSKYLARLHKKYPVIRIGPDALSYGDPRAIKEIYGHNTKCKKDDLYVITSGTHFHLADVIESKEHSRKRKVLSSAYALKNLETWEHKVGDKTARLITHFDQMCTAPLPKGQVKPRPEDLNVDYRAWTNFFTIEAIADIGLSERLGFLDTGSDMCSAERLDGSTYEVGFRDALYQNARKQSLVVWNYDWYPFINKLVDIIPFYKKMSNHARDWDAIYLSRSSKRLKRFEAGEKLDDFFQALMEDKNGSPNNLEWGEIVAEVGIMMNAGSATTAIAMANIMFQLLKNPRVMATLRKEVDSVLDDDEVVASYDKVKHLPYLRACLDESLRLFPPTSHGLTRATPPEGMNIMGEYVGGNTSVSVSAYVAHRDETIFPNADKFIPERWLGDEGKALQPYFLAFSAGARGCIGRNISYLEQTVLLASVLHRYEFALPSPEWELQRLETMNLILGEMPVKVWRREHGAESEAVPV